jgi:hypothetical protein
MKAVLATEIGTRVSLRIFWGASEDCPNCLGGGRKGYHDVKVRLFDLTELRAWTAGGKREDYPETQWPTRCDHCGAEVSGEHTRQVFREKLYDTPDGRLHPGCLFFEDYLHFDDGKCIYWNNCTTPHLFAILPNGRWWDIDSRASNCDQPNDRMHRCWVRSGEPPNVTAGKTGHTCGAGGGSIAAGDYHGFLRGGEFVTA